MTRSVCALMAMVAVAATASAQTPRLSNGTIQPHQTTNIARDLPALAATLAEPMWIGYAQPLIEGDRTMCDSWSDGRTVTASTDPIHLEPSSVFFVLFRIEDRQVTRIRTYSDNCPLDAGGKAVHWFTNVSAADSLAFMKTFIGGNASTRLDQAATAVVAMTRGDEALDMLLNVARGGATTQMRGNALFWLAQRAGDKAVGTISAAIQNDPDTEVKRRAVFVLSQLPKNEGVPLLIEQARTNRNPAVRKQAMFWLGQSKDPRALRFFEELLK